MLIAREWHEWAARDARRTSLSRRHGNVLEEGEQSADQIKVLDEQTGEVGTTFGLTLVDEVRSLL